MSENIITMKEIPEKDYKEPDKAQTKQLYRAMELVMQVDYEEFVKSHDSVMIEDQAVPIGRKWVIDKFGPDKDYKFETETVWSFLNRGDWATHIGNYRGNWSPFIPRNLITRYTKPGEWVLDQMVGSGTTAVECKLLGRHGKFLDVNPNAIMVTRDRLNFDYVSVDPDYPNGLKLETYIGDARNLDKIDNDSIDLIATHPPYAYIISYSKSKVEGDLSSLKSLKDYLPAMRKIADECFRVLKRGKHCAILIGDTRHHKHYVPIAVRVLQEFLNAGFILREDIIKRQWKTKTTRERWRSSKLDFYRIAHEHLYVFRKPENEEEKKKFKLSTKWWSEQRLTETPQNTQSTEPKQITTTNVEAFETRLNPYGFVYIPKNALTSLPFKTGDKLHLKIDRANNRVIITTA
jgi:DNA modification methylase